MTLKEDYKNAFNNLYIAVMREKGGCLQAAHVDKEFFRRAGTKEVAGYLLTFYPENWRTSMECIGHDMAQGTDMKFVEAMLEDVENEQETIRKQIASGEAPAAEGTAGQEGTAGKQQEGTQASSREAIYAKVLEDALYTFHSLRRHCPGTASITAIITEKLGGGREVNEWLQANLAPVYRKWKGGHFVQEKARDFVTFENTAVANKLMGSYGKMLKSCTEVRAQHHDPCCGACIRSVFNSMADAEANAGRWLTQYGRNAFRMWCEYSGSDKAVTPTIEEATGRILRKVCLGRESIFSSPKDDRASLVAKYNSLVALCMGQAAQICGRAAAEDPQHLAAGMLFGRLAGPRELAGWYLSLYKDDARQMWGCHLADKERITGTLPDKADLKVLQLLEGCR